MTESINPIAIPQIAVKKRIRKKSKSPCPNCNIPIDASQLRTLSHFRETRQATNEPKVICDNCSIHFLSCDICTVYFPRELNNFTEVNRDLVCTNCLDEAFFTCDICNIIQNNDNYGEDNVCTTCCNDRDSENDRERENDRENEENRDLLHDYSHKPYPIFYDLVNGKITTHEKPSLNTLYMGIELEINIPSNRNFTINQIIEMVNTFLDTTGIEGIFYFKSDGSLNSDLGIEIVSHPISYPLLSYLKPKVVDLLNSLSKIGCTSYDNNECGIHIHINKSYIGNTTLYKILTFANYNEKFLFQISQRKLGQFLQWAKVSALDNDTAKQIAIQKGCSMVDIARYTAFNAIPKHTLECRIFRGTLNPKSFYKNIQFYHALIHHLRDSSLVSFLDVGDFYRYVIKNRVNYPDLFHFLQVIKLNGELCRSGAKINRDNEDD